MKVYLMSDLEGAAGVLDSVNWCYPDSRYYELAKELLTREVNAAGEDVAPERHRREVVGALVEPPAAPVARDLVREGHVCAAGDRDRRAARGVDVGPAARGIVRRGRFRRTPRELGQLGRFARPVRVDDRPHGGLVDES